MTPVSALLNSCDWVMQPGGETHSSPQPAYRWHVEHAEKWNGVNVSLKYANEAQVMQCWRASVSLDPSWW